MAVGFALAVTLPNAGNLGGGGFMVLHDAKSGRNIALDFRETAPAKASRDMYLDAQGKVADGRSLYTHLAVGVPGTVAGLAHAQQRWGDLPLAKVIAPAVRLAEQGFAVSQTLAEMLEVERTIWAAGTAAARCFSAMAAPCAPARSWCSATWQIAAPDRAARTEGVLPGRHRRQDRGGDGAPRRPDLQGGSGWLQG